jgi:hypothetical protein
MGGAHVEHCRAKLYADVPKHLPIIAVGPGATALVHPLDVICCVKRHVSDTECCQPPMLAIPFERIQRTTQSVPTTPREHNIPSHDLQRDWLALAEYVLDTWPNEVGMSNAAQYLLDLTTNGHLQTDDSHAFPFHQSRPHAALLTLQALESGTSAASYMMPVATMKWVIRKLR